MKIRSKRIYEAYQYSGNPENPGWPDGWLIIDYVPPHKKYIFVIESEEDENPLRVRPGEVIIKLKEGFIIGEDLEVFKKSYEVIDG